MIDKLDDCAIVFFDGNVLLRREGDNARLPSRSELSHISFNFDYEFYVDNVFVANAIEKVNLPEVFFFEERRPAFMLLGPEHSKVIGKAYQRVHWNNTHQYCGQCGEQTQEKNNELSKVCVACGHACYPRISPSIIVLVTRGEELLLARSPHFPSGRFSALAGFVEPGETIEETVHREVLEEVGIEIENVVYVGSQPWPFPHSLMLGFYATHKSGDILIDGVEIEEAAWFTKDHLPDLPPDISIARQLIDGFLA